jgi:peptidoglycan/xylan/chitin deacetylase (PgdA/CDA1 family)
LKRHTRIVRSRAFVLFLISLMVMGGARAISGSVQAASVRRATLSSQRAEVVRELKHPGGVPVLEYHVVGFHPKGSPLEGLYVLPSLFARQVQLLAQHGWHGVTLRAVIAYWREGKALPSKPVVFSFDDGYPGDWRYALPVLKAHHWPGDLNLQIGNLVPKRVRELIAAGWEIDSHTFTHPDLTTVGPVRLEHEVLDSRFWIQRMFRVPADVFCYPLGRYNAATVAEVRRAGYLAAETENAGVANPAQGLLTLDRVRVGPTTTPGELESLLR